jgi:hypothetical protein
MSIRFLIFALAFALALIAQAADESLVLHEPDHLVPVDPYPGDWHVRYSDQICARFKLAPEYDLQMLVRPSFSAEYVVRLYSDKKNPCDSSAAEKVFLRYSIADKSIFYSMPENNLKKKRQKITVSTTTIDFPKALSARLHDLWERMLLRTRYPEEPNGGLDGTTYEFAMWCVYGETWSPNERKSPLLFIELGESLIGYCKAAPEELAR